MGARPLVLLTDFGAKDFYAGVTRAVIAASSPASRIIDLQHDLPAHNIDRASFVLARSFDYLPDDAVVVVVVDPGVGTERRGLMVELGGRVLVGPNNGFMSDLLWSGRGETGLSVPVFLEIDEERARRETGVQPRGATFHGRDIFGPVAAAIARGMNISSFGRAIEGITLLRNIPSVSVDGGRVRGTGRYVDHFGNLLTDIPVAVVQRTLPANAEVCVTADGRDLGRLHRTYAETPPGTLMALVNSWGMVEAAVNGGCAIDQFAHTEPRAIHFELSAR